MLTLELQQKIERLIIPATIKTLQMVLFASLFSVIIGTILGVILYIVKKDGLKPNKILFFIINGIVNVGRSIPFIILIFIFFPVTRLIVGTSIGTKAASVSLMFAAIPFVARVMETTFNEIDDGLIEAAKAMGVSNMQILTKVVLLESAQSIVSNITVTIINIVGYSAMAGSLGGGGLGDVALTQGFQRNQADMLIISTVLLIIFVQIIQFLGNYFSKKIVYILKYLRNLKRNRSKNRKIKGA